MAPPHRADRDLHRRPATCARFPLPSAPRPHRPSTLDRKALPACPPSVIQKHRPPMPVRRHGFPERIHLPFSLFRRDSSLKGHPDYLHAKAGAVEAATRLVSDLALPNPSLPSYNPVMQRKSPNSSAFSPMPLPPTKPPTSSASVRLTRSEIDSLRQGKKQIADYAQNALKSSIAKAVAAAMD